MTDLIRRRRGDERAALVERALDDTAARVEQAEPAAREQQRELLLTGWQTLLSDLLAEHSGGDERSDIAEELRTLVEEVTTALPVAGQRWVQNVTISGASIGQTVMGGSIVNHSPLR
ncbi:hypothetical protein [Micromonospora sp. ATCC 39149]|uniref:hypothetical protein n=1 Tax=Micromonospora sp. (strain ATCC 39149 / NRRL 15099 / SCC 1413) TaxID=219305 RepID=UPI0012F7A0C9|nr:hypothetical protein [Micromonospora sp. ATCC 39149]